MGEICDSRAVIKHFGVSPWRLPLIANDMRKRGAGADIPLFADTPRLLDRFTKAGVTMAIVSSNAEATIRRVLGPSAGAISHYACGASLFGKAAKFEAVLRATGVAPADAVGIGDETRDVDAAKATGIASAAVTWGYARRPALEAARPDFIFDTADALIGGLLA
ncbi:MAG: HAD family hydrolase [Methylocystaceae bacterium]|nr:HAD family hydrolase [Methylocystaceae bacterium]